ncbi:hypothetical protein DXK94_06305 [Arthrobacter sp. RT-1]|uniref:hypothetical protein n=1 Tax=Arthrobacter sp. RT-1 TaxID=2292263 RepID=UPI000E1EC133|nr:hypothetical protein [Arthrobacter sp. RT-1]RDV11272.1 hypothetical protein DXK94_06305 [Arthrobacter sp. RT-1]
MLEWLPIGPVGRGDPIWYVNLKNRNCGAVPGFSAPLNTVEEAAQALCSGLAGDDAAWQQGTSALDTMERPVEGVSDCYTVVAYDVLQDIAAVRQQRPDARLQLAARNGTACQPQLSGLEDEDGSSPVGVCPGSAIVLSGNVTGLPTGSVREVSVGTATAKVWQRQSFVDNNHPLEFYFLAPALAQGAPATVSVTVTDADYPVGGTVTFDYAADQTACPQAPSTGP